MNLLTQHLDTWTTAPNGIKKLRELILELAVRGLLVPQNPDDEPASVLLEKIADEKARLISEGKIKKSAPLPKIADDEKPFDLPDGWEWVRLPEVYYGISPSGKKILSSKISEIGLHPVVDQGKKFIAGYTNQQELLIKINGAVVVFGDHTKEFKYIDFDFVAGADGVKILCPFCMNEKFFYIQMMSYSLEDRGYSRYFKILNGNLFSLPPLAEQHRIVAKVDELMQLCDQLEQKQTSNQDIHAQLVSTLLTTLTQATDPQAFQAAWTRIAANFNSLFTTESSIEQLKQTILQLAVMGKLVEQEAGDEPASVLLEKIAQEKARLISEGKIKKSAPLPKISDDEKPFDLPDGWEWVRLPEVYYGISPSGKKILSSKISEIGLHPVVDQGKKFIAGYTNQQELLIKINGAVVVFGDHTKEFKYLTLRTDRILQSS